MMIGSRRERTLPMVYFMAPTDEMAEQKKQKEKVDFVIYGRKIKLFTNKHK